MEKYHLQTEMKSEPQQKYAVLSRGYDPLQEIYHWSLIISLLLGETILVGISFMPQIDSVSFLTTLLIWHISFGMALPLFLVMFVITASCLTVLRYRREKHKRERLRQSALLGNSQPLAPLQPALPFAQIALPIRLESRLNKRFTRWISICVLVALPLLVIDILTLRGALWQVPFFLVEIIYLCSIVIPGAAAGIGRAIQMRVTGHYLHPSLHIDDMGISARYGKETIFIAWQNVRSFALVNSVAFSKVPGKKTVQREAYEISDGTNRICWLVGSPMPSYDLLWFDEVVLSAQDYTAFTQLFAALIVTKAGCPLLDFRLPLRKRKKSSDSPGVSPSSAWKEYV